MKLRNFWSKVYKNPENGCWEWTGATRNAGYGAFKFDGKVYDVHRFVWNIILKRPIPDGKVVCHECDNKICVNPDHLKLGTQQENLRDMHKRGRDNHPRGRDVKISKLNEEKVQQIRALFETGQHTFSELATAFGVDKSTIRMVIIKKTWKHV